MGQRSTLPLPVQDLVTQHVASLEAMQVLLVLHSAPTRAWTSGEVAVATSLDEVSATRQLVVLRQRGLLAVEMTDDAAYRYNAAGELASAVDGLAECFRARPLDVAALIASRPQHRLRLFADAFRLRRRE
jgi:hypothetical protein